MTTADGPPHTSPMPSSAPSSASLSFPLRGDRVLLRPFEPADADAAHAVYGDEEVMRHVGEGGAVSREETAQMIEGYRRHQHEHGFACWAVVDRGTGELIGDAGLEITAHGVELGYTLTRSAWGRGLATEAGRLCIAAAFGPLGLPRLVALADVDNPASLRVLEKLGFRRAAEVAAFGRAHHALELAAPGDEQASPSPA